MLPYPSKMVVLFFDLDFIRYGESILSYRGMKCLSIATVTGFLNIPSFFRCDTVLSIPSDKPNNICCSVIDWIAFLIHLPHGFGPSDCIVNPFIADSEYVFAVHIAVIP